jgi:hypothetical protein
MRWRRRLVLWVAMAAVSGMSAGLPARPAVPGQARPAQKPAAAPKTPEAPAHGPLPRLVLKDGSYQEVTAYEVKGSRVRYFSADRHAWEELPYALVDWAASERFAAQAAAEKSDRSVRSARAAADARAATDAANPEVAPGIRLPDAGGAFLLDRFQARPDLVPLRQNGADVDKHVAGNILRGILNPVAGSKRTIELAGPHAAVQAHVTGPEIYLALEPGDDPGTDYTPRTAAEHFRLVRCQEKKGNRIVGTVNIAVYGKVSSDAGYLATRVEPAGGPWIKVTPAAPLATGEYALVELLGKQGINAFVWDFGVNPAAPANSRSRVIDPSAPTGPPVLHDRTKKTPRP